MLSPDSTSSKGRMNAILNAWNASEYDDAIAALLSCCASTRWAEQLAAQRPFDTEEKLFAAADTVWATMQQEDWMQAFRAHPRIGERKVEHATAQSRAWSLQEQASAQEDEERFLAALRRSQVRYEEQFGFPFIVCATGKSAGEILTILGRRLNDGFPQDELREAAEQQRQITQIRLRKWLAL
jgi:2-oxo-4-hydroxy-4-carboxy-5-ureidoimidazoline decarboxylase